MNKNYYFYYLLIFLLLFSQIFSYTQQHKKTLTHFEQGLFSTTVLYYKNSQPTFKKDLYLIHIKHSEKTKKNGYFLFYPSEQEIEILPYSRNFAGLFFSKDGESAYKSGFILLNNKEYYMEKINLTTTKDLKSIIMHRSGFISFLYLKLKLKKKDFEKITDQKRISTLLVDFKKSYDKSMHYLDTAYDESNPK